MIEVVSGLTLSRLPLIGGVALEELGTWFASAEAEDTRRRCADVPGERDGHCKRHETRRGRACLAVEQRAVEFRGDPISSHMEHLAVSCARRSELVLSALLGADRRLGARDQVLGCLSRVPMLLIRLLPLTLEVV